MDQLGWRPKYLGQLGHLDLLEIVLGIDNVIFISILAGKLPPTQRVKARTIGLGLALVTRILLLLSIKWLMGLTEPLGAVFSHPVSGRDLILIAGGLFLIAKSTHEIHVKLEAAGFEVQRLTSVGLSLLVPAVLLRRVQASDQPRESRTGVKLTLQVVDHEARTQRNCGSHTKEHKRQYDDGPSEQDRAEAS